MFEKLHFLATIQVTLKKRQQYLLIFLLLKILLIPFLQIRLFQGKQVEMLHSFNFSLCTISLIASTGWLKSTASFLPQILCTCLGGAGGGWMQSSTIARSLIKLFGCTCCLVYKHIHTGTKLLKHNTNTVGLTGSCDVFLLCFAWQCNSSGGGEVELQWHNGLNISCNNWRPVKINFII